MSIHVMDSRKALRLVGAMFGLAMALPAQANLTIQLERLSDTDAVMLISGELDSAPPGGNAHALALMDPFSARPADADNSWVLEDSDLRAGSFVFNFANQAGRCATACPGTPVSPGVSFDNGGRANTIYFGNNDLVFPLPFPFQAIPSNTPFAGSMRLALQNDATFAPIGASGDVLWGTTEIGLGAGVLVGSWEMVGAPPVPEPATCAMMLAGLGLAGFVVRRRALDLAGATRRTGGTGPARRQGNSDS